MKLSLAVIGNHNVYRKGLTCAPTSTNKQKLEKNLKAQCNAKKLKVKCTSFLTVQLQQPRDVYRNINGKDLDSHVIGSLVS